MEFNYIMKEPINKCHAYHVVHNAIGLLEYSDEPVVLILAALFHDIGNYKCKTRKVVESELKEFPERKIDSYHQRIEHQYWSILETIEVMEKLGFKDSTINKVVKLVGVHDLRKCGLGYCIKNKEEQLLNEADAGWMLSEDGIKRDQDRARENNFKPLSDEEQLNHNRSTIGNLFKYFNK